MPPRVRKITWHSFKEVPPDLNENLGSLFLFLPRKVARFLTRKKISRILEESAVMDTKDPKDTTAKAPAVAAETSDPVRAAAPLRKGANSHLFNDSLARLTFMSS